MRRRKGRISKTAPLRDEGAAGWENGYLEGRSDGYHYGLCESIYARAAPEAAPSRNIKVLYVKAEGSPYASLDQGIEEALRASVREVVVASPNDDVAQLAEAANPDLVLVLDAAGCSFKTEQVDRMRDGGLLTAVWLPDDPYHSDATADIARHYDYVFTIEANCVSMYRDIGCCRVFHLPFGVNPGFTRHVRVDETYRHDICFVGSAFWNRVAYFDEIADYLAAKRVKIIGYWWERLRQYEKLASRIEGVWMSPEETAKYYSGAKIVINLHRSADDKSHNSNSRNVPAHSVNPRLFEIASCAAFQLVDNRPELSQFYTPGVEIATFESPSDLVGKLDYYLTHDEERREIARRGLYRTVNEHTYRNRIQRLLSVIFG
ncbi:CgeB family protein [Paenibacillus ginsengarvi]|uniref:Spore maturation protein cgeB n=1 Tax=Paenibacillus ginsengarvi TaxID=400777 RepID=A0A3B0CLP5_9BACL|nr:glycosyltransferase [Paenibacillus ginsengarvi]RKN85287.1 spore maturation protein cgeB [Paenibacillus ginsengarvi]